MKDEVRWQTLDIPAHGPRHVRISSIGRQALFFTYLAIVAAFITLGVYFWNDAGETIQLSRPVDWAVPTVCTAFFCGVGLWLVRRRIDWQAMMLREADAFPSFITEVKITRGRNENEADRATVTVIYQEVLGVNELTFPITPSIGEDLRNRPNQVLLRLWAGRSTFLSQLRHVELVN